MKKAMKWIQAGFILALVLFIAGCGGEEANSTSDSTDTEKGQESSGTEFEETTFKFGHHLAEDHILSQQVQKFADLVSEKTNGQVKINIYPAGQLGGQKELIDGVQMGTVDMTVVDTGVLSNFYQPLALLDAPYVFESMDHAIKSLNGELGNKLKKDINAETGLKVLTLEPTSFRSTALTEHAVDSAESFSFEDFSGLKIRVLDSPAVIQTFESFGAQPATIPSGEAYTSMQTDVVDGMESNPEFFKSINVDEVGKYVADTKHVLVNQAILMDEKKFNNLPENTQQVIEEAMKEVTQWFNETAYQADQDAREELKDRGMEFIELDLTKFRKASSDYTEKFVKENGLEDYYQLIEDAKGE